MSIKQPTPALGTGKSKSRKVRRKPIQRKKIAGGTITIQERTVGKFVARVVVHVGGKSTTKGFETLEAAKAYALRQEIEAENAGTRAASTIGDKERRAMLDAKERLAPYGKTVVDALNFYLAHLEASAKSSTVAAMVETLLSHKRTEGKAVRYLRDLKSRLGRFAVDYGTRPIGDITPEEISVWLSGLNLAPVGTNNFRRCLAVLFNYAAERGFAPQNVMRRTVRMKQVEEEIEILTVGECDALMRGAHDSIRPALALAIFCGVRDDEVRRLDWRAVDWEGDSLIIGANVSKVNQRRIVPLRENVKAWLAPLRQTGGLIHPVGRAAKAHLQAARAAAGFGTPAACKDDKSLRPWLNNALRHSYASYALAQWPDAAALALEMGNSPAVILKHYRQLVKPAAAAAFWKITPANRPEGKDADLPSAKTA
ncbi:MAG: site-specific integrase [Verrucomicrobiota bacterium]